MDLSSATSSLQSVSQRLFASIGTFQLPGGFIFEPSYLQAGLIVFLIFLLILTFGMLQHRYNHWTVKGVMPGVAFGFTLALLLEAMFLVGGRTILTEVLAWKNPPKPISNALEASRSELINVLGANSTVPDSNASALESSDEIMSSFENLSEKEREKLQSEICPR